MLKIIYEDNHILCAVKPANIPVQEDESNDIDFLSILKEYLKQKYDKPGNVYLGLLHRLDRPVGGIMVFAKTSKAASRLSMQFRNKEIFKEYLAITNGVPENKKNRLVNYLNKNRKENKTYITGEKDKESKKAELIYEVLKTENGLALVKVMLITGRSHQIRVQMAGINSPLYGDQKYGTNQDDRKKQIALWSTKITLKHPVTKESMTFFAQPPESLPWNNFKKPIEIYFNS